MKKNKREIFLEELGKTSNVSVACEKIGLSRQTVYRWKEESREFEKSFDEAISHGIDSVNDLAESRVITRIKNGEFGACKYWLDNHKKDYVRPRPEGFWDKLTNNDRVDRIEVKLFTKPEDVEKDRKDKENGTESNEGWTESDLIT
jgi:hypothetical protein